MAITSRLCSMVCLRQGLIWVGLPTLPGVWPPLPLDRSCPGAASWCLTLAEGRHRREMSAAEAFLIRCRPQPSGAKQSLLGTRGWPVGASRKIRASRLRLTWDRHPSAGPVPLLEGTGWEPDHSLPLCQPDASHKAQLYFLFVSHAGGFSLVKVLETWGFGLVGRVRI